MSTPSHTAPSDLIAYARLENAQLLENVNSSIDGISEGEAQDRLKQIGANTIAHEEQISIPLQLLRRLRNPLNLLLITLASVSFGMGDHVAALIIFVMVVLSISLAFMQEHRSNQAAEKLRAMVHTTATVLRKQNTAPGTMKEIAIHLLVPGDIVHLSAGDMVPADLRLLSAKDLFINQAPLTGEAMPVEKSAGPTTVETSNPLDLPNLCFMGTNVISGTAIGVILETGSRAYFGSVADIISGERTLTSFDKGISRFTTLMLRFILVMAPLVFLINGLTKGDWVEALFFAVAVAVGLTPEMLPMIVTVNLSKGALAMSRKKVIVKRLNAIQNFGAMDVLCSDKTGTLTRDEIILEKHVDLSGQASPKVLQYAYLNSFYQSGLKNLLDIAVLKHSEVHEALQPVTEFSKVDEIPFDFSRRRMSVIVAYRGRHLLICKGAVEEVFGVSTNGEEGERRFDLDESHLLKLKRVSNELNEDGLRVIALAYKELPPEQTTYTVKDECDLVLIGYIAFLDPPKDSAQEAIAKLNAHGVQIKILTGDNELVTRKVCRQVGMQVDRVLLGSDIESMSPDQLADAAEQTQVFAKLSPTQKATIIEALHKKGHVVGFLGDGINDGPALKSADVGISVDTAVDIAKESADIILLEKSLLVLDDGVIEGRKVFGNIVKYIRMGSSSNFGNMFSVIGASAWLPFLPMAPIQVLTNNLLYDFSQTAIPTDNVDEEYLAKPRRWEIRNIAHFMLFIGPISSLFDYVTFLTMYYFFQANTAQSAALFQTGWFVESLLSQTLIIHIIRTNRIPFLESRASTPLILTSLTICAVGVWLPYSPFAHSLGFTALPLVYWPIITVLMIVYMSLTHLMKTWFHRRFGLD
ncbi:Mg2+-importing ATPase [Oxalobacteraceae bacterium GrIS 2.11]